MPSIRWFFTAAIVVTGVSLQAQTGPSLVGEWGHVLSWPSEVTHASLLANGKVLVWPAYSLGDNARVWDPATNGNLRVQVTDDPESWVKNKISARTECCALLANYQ